MKLKRGKVLNLVVKEEKCSNEIKFNVSIVEIFKCLKAFRRPELVELVV